ncbi:MAG: ABC transporter ATP-binding protein [Nanoarchaeota archaeon]|mgnify:CR=1 FL=1
MSLEKRRYSNFEFAKDLWYFLKVHKGQFFFFTSLLILSSLLGLVPAIILSKMIDLFSSANISSDTFYIYLAFLASVLIFDTFLRHTSKYYFILLTNKIQKHAKVEAFEKIMQGDLIWHDKENTGNKIQKISEGESSIADFMNFYINKGISLVVDIIGIILIFAFFNLKYAFVAGLFIFCYLFFEFKLNKKVSQKSLEINIAKEKSMGKTFEFSSNISTVKSLGMECSSNKQIALQEEKVLQAKKARRKASTQKWIVVQIVAVLFYSIFLFLVGRDIIAGILTIGVLVIYVNYVSRLQSALNTISVEATNLIDMKYGIYRMMQIFKSVPELQEEDAENLKGWNKIKINNLTFKYKRDKVLDNLNLEIKRGQKIGIVGCSGSGKSTLFKLLLKLYAPEKGSILFDNQSLANIKKNSLLEKISIVPQETELFNLTLKENITISSSKDTDYNQYEKALRISQISGVISKLKNKDLTMIGEKGVRLSGGERQRLGIARAVYKGSEIIILDEATSNLDYETERKILESFDRELKDKTLIVSAHRITTLKSMDKIFFLEKGKIVEEGTYQELIRKKGKFYNLLKNRENK